MTEQVQNGRAEHRAMEPEVNPFVHRFNFTVWDYIRIAFMSVTIAPIRFVLAFSLLALDWLTAKIGFIGRTEEDTLTPMTGWRSKWLQFPIGFLFRCVFFCMGFHWIVIKGKHAPHSEAQIAVAAPHSNFFDNVIFPIMNLPSVVAKTNTVNIPLIGPLVNFLQPVYVSRKDPNSRLNTIKEIKKRCAPGSGWPQIVIFPEGTCTNRTCLISFKGGAFYPGVPVQPIAMRYITKPDTFTWTWDGPGALALLWFTMCNFNNRLEIEFLPVYKPSQEEKDDPKLYARNVRAVIAKALNLPVTDHTYEDCRMMDQARSQGLLISEGIEELQVLLAKLGIKVETIEEKLERFTEIAQTEGCITIDDLAQYLNVPISPAVEEMFALYDRDGSNKIDFREYVIACSLLPQSANGEQTLRLAFKLYNGEKDSIELDQLCTILGRGFDMKREDCEILFKLIDGKELGHITLDAFKEYAKKRPEYLRLFMSRKAPSHSNGNGSIPNGNGSSKKSD